MSCLYSSKSSEASGLECIRSNSSNLNSIPSEDSRGDFGSGYGSHWFRSVADGWALVVVGSGYALVRLVRRIVVHWRWSRCSGDQHCRKQATILTT